jgi:hypothetical protein
MTMRSLPSGKNAAVLYLEFLIIYLPVSSGAMIQRGTVVDVAERTRGEADERCL